MTASPSPRSRLRPLPVGTAAGLDAGVQPERTTLAWSRTTLALVTVSAVFLRWVPHYGWWMLLLPLLTGLAAAAVTGSQRSRTRRGVRAIEAGACAAHPAPLLGLTGLALALGVVGLVLVVVAP